MGEQRLLAMMQDTTQISRAIPANPAAASAASSFPASFEDDATLLDRFARERSDDAFTELVARHIDHVYHLACRQVRDASLAEDIAQAVFILLATKARSLSKDVVLAGWLHRAAYLTSRQAVRTRNRRLIHERRAAEMKNRIDATALSMSPAALLDEMTDATEMSAGLDVALAQLGERDRDALLMRYMRAQSMAEVGRAMGISEDAATKRVHRALVKVRRSLLRKNVNVTETGIPSLLAAQHLATAPSGMAAHVGATALGAAHGVVSSGAAFVLAKSVASAVMWTRAKTVAVCIGSIIVIGAATVATILLRQHQQAQTPVAAVAPPAMPIVFPDGPVAPDLPSFKTVAVDDPALAGFPYAPGWPRVLPGAIFSSPVLADLEGDGKLDIIETCAPSASHGAEAGETPVYAHPSPNALPLMFAIRPDGTTVPGWPVTIGTERQARPPHASPWMSSPSVFRNRDGRDGLVIRGPGGAPTFVFNSNRSSIKITTSNPACSISIADFNHDGVMAFSVGKSLSTLQGGEVPGWPATRKFRNGFAPCIGDALGDGHLYLYQHFYPDKVTGLCDIIGVDAHGNQLPGWPQRIEDGSWAPAVMGDVTGDDKMEVLFVGGHRLYAWTWDGKPLPNTTSDGELTGILKSDVVQNTAALSLADIDGDGKAEIIVFDDASHTIRAWHGDGTPLSPAPAGDAGPDGVIAQVPGDTHGVSVVSLGDDPRVMDFFAGSWWIRRTPDGKTVSKNMLPGEAATEWIQPTIADVEGNGKADVIFGLSDGRLFVYRTGLAYHAERMQWPTAHGNFQHTGAWHRPRPASSHE
jgi:RNA polymerase sigma factor (sigma-70 family)